MKPNLFLLIPVLSIISCNNINYEYIDDTNFKINNIELIDMQLPNIGLLPMEICFVDSFLVVSNDDYNEDYLSVYHKNKFICSFGKKGQGSTDLLYPTFVSAGKVINRYLPIKSNFDLRYYDFSTITNLSEPSFFVEELPQETLLTNFLVYNSDSLLVMNRTGDHQLTFYNKITKECQNFSYYPDKIFGDKVPDVIYNINVFQQYYISNNNIIIATCYWHKIINLISLDGKLIKQIRFKDYDSNYSKFYIKDDFGNVGRDNATKYFSSIIVDNNYFYAISQDEEDEIVRNRKNKTYLYKFDYSGNLLKKYQFDLKVTFGVIKNDTIYCLGYKESEDAKIYYGKL